MARDTYPEACSRPTTLFSLTGRVPNSDKQEMNHDAAGGGGGMAGMDDSSMPMSMPMSMDLTFKCTCRVGKLFVSAWDIQTCGTYYASLAFIALFCFLRHLLTMHKTKLILRLADQDAGTQQ
jgi:hypothetical protein